ncbi:MAG: DNA repair protein RecO [Chthonomonadales bacterium]|nr:DNA repair protein RecO [Chthonomonadales bacterium]
MEPYAALAIVLRRRDIGENDRIVTLLTSEYGKIEAAARGSRKAGARAAGASEPFTELNLRIAHGRRLDVVIQWHVINAHGHLRSNLSQLARASYICEVAELFTIDHDPCPAVYDLVSGSLSALESGFIEHDGAGLDCVVRAFEVQLVEIQGYAISTRACSHCGRAISLDHLDARSPFSPMLGGVLCSACRYRASDAYSVSPDVLLTIERLKTQNLGNAADLRLDATLASEVGRCLRWFLRHRCERETKAATFLELIRHDEGLERDGDSIQYRRGD